MCQLSDANPGLKGHRSLCILWQGPALIKVKIKVPSSLMASILVQLLLCDAISKINICCSSSCHSNYPGCGTLIYQYRPFVCNYVYSHVFPHDESKVIEARVEALWSAISFRSVRSEVSLCSCLWLAHGKCFYELRFWTYGCKWGGCWAPLHWVIHYMAFIARYGKGSCSSWAICSVLISLSVAVCPKLEVPLVAVLHRWCDSRFMVPLPSQLQSVTALWPVPNYTAWHQRHMLMNELLGIPAWKCSSWESKHVNCWLQVH